MMRHRVGGGVGGGGYPSDSYGVGGGGAMNLGYGGVYGGGAFKDKPHHRKRGSFVVPAFAKSPWFGFAASLVLGLLALHYRWQSSGLLKALQVSSPRQGKELVDRLKTERQDAERGLQKAKMAEKQALVRVQALEKQQRTLEQERDNYRKLASSTAGSGGGGIAAAVGSALSSPEVAKKRELDLISFLHRLQNSTQRASKEAVLAKFGPGPHRVQFSVKLGDSAESVQRFVVEMAPLEAAPHAVHVFLEQAHAGLWNSAWFYLNGPHVAQCGPRVASEEDVDDDKLDDREVALKPFAERGLASLYYPEYSPLFPHERWTLGMTGRPGGPDWYINKKNNTVGHAPGGQGQLPLGDLYGDPCFARVVEGFDTLERVFAQPTYQSGDYRFFFENPIHVVKAEIVSPIAPQLTPWQAREQAQQQQTTIPQDGAQPGLAQQKEKPPEQLQQAQSQQQAPPQEQQQGQQQQQQLPEQQQKQSPVDSLKEHDASAVSDGAATVGSASSSANEAAAAAGGSGGGSGGDGKKRMRQLMMAKLPPLNVEP